MNDAIKLIKLNDPKIKKKIKILKTDKTIDYNKLNQTSYYGFLVWFESIENPRAQVYQTYHKPVMDFKSFVIHVVFKKMKLCFVKWRKMFSWNNVL